MNIRQTDENVIIDLYKDFAAIKGEFVFYNSSKVPIVIKIGYRSDYYKYEAKEYSILSDKKSLNIIKYQLNNNSNELKQIKISKNSKWNKWECDWYDENNRYKEYEFEIKSFISDTLKIFAYVDIDNGEIDKGLYNNTILMNIFAYNLGCSSYLNKPIEKFKLSIQLKDGIQLSDIFAIFPQNNLKTFFSKKKLVFEGNNIDNTFSDIIIAHDSKPFWLFDYSWFFRYSKQEKRELALKIETDNVENVVDSELYPNNISDLKFEKQNDTNNFETAPLLAPVLSILLELSKFGILLVIVLLFIFIVLMIIKMIRKRKLP